jgi:N-acetylneuraminic acid mutarotase
MPFFRTSFFAVTLLGCIASSPALAQWQKLPPMPQPSAGFASGADSDGIVVIGGTNWKDGTKNWLRDINRFDPQTLRWSVVGKLDAPLAYAVCDIRRSDGALVILGGSDGKAPVPALVVVSKSTAAVELAPTLPRHVVLSAGGIIGDDFIIAGGTDDATNIPGFTQDVFAWNLKSKTLTELPDYPGKPFAMAAAAVVGDELFLFGGANPTNGITNTAEAYAFSPATKRWRKLKSCPLAARGSAAVALDEHRIYLAGGYGGTPEGFLTVAFLYDTRADSYSPATAIPFAATASLIKHDGFVYCFGGEDKPKSRTDAMWRIGVEALLK